MVAGQREAHELLLIEEADAWFEYLEATRAQSALRYKEVESRVASDGKLRFPSELDTAAARLNVRGPSPRTSTASWASGGHWSACGGAAHPRTREVAYTTREFAYS